MRGCRAHRIVRFPSSVPFRTSCVTRSKTKNQIKYPHTTPQICDCSAFPLCNGTILTWKCIRRERRRRAMHRLDDRNGTGGRTRRFVWYQSITSQTRIQTQTRRLLVPILFCYPLGPTTTTTTITSSSPWYHYHQDFTILVVTITNTNVYYFCLFVYFPVPSLFNTMAYYPQHHVRIINKRK